MFVAARQRIGAIDRQRSLTGSANDFRCAARNLRLFDGDETGGYRTLDGVACG